LSSALKDSAFTVINYRRELIAQKLDDNGIHSITPQGRGQLVFD